ncbi:MAG: hypothetical protein GWP08_21550, partial [Nitrospiraceae bacterium]|nr:hypothetical protein [Nitrospiraceae bacterium]
MGVEDYPEARVQQTYDTVKSLQPNCLVVMHDPGQSGRWPTDVFQPGRNLPAAGGHDPRMTRHGKTYYIPADVIDTVVEKWFWNPDVGPRPLADLLNGYREVTAHEANFTLNAGVNMQGRLPADQVNRLLELAEAIKQLDNE